MAGVRIIGVRAVTIMAIVMAVVAGILIPDVVTGQTTCNVNLHDAMTQCAAYVQKLGPQLDPSQGCCNVIKGVDVLCACSMITPDIEGYLSMPKAVHVVQFCGVHLTHGMKCGSYTIP